MAVWWEGKWTGYFEKELGKSVTQVQAHDLTTSGSYLLNKLLSELAQFHCHNFIDGVLLAEFIDTDIPWVHPTNSGVISVSGFTERSWKVLTVCCLVEVGDRTFSFHTLPQ
ncbi:MAG: hypothetical protein AAGC93_10625 [Cyanobacteria bacterium P01_F01_bin.53]